MFICYGIYKLPAKSGTHLAFTLDRSAALKYLVLKMPSKQPLTLALHTQTFVRRVTE